MEERGEDSNSNRKIILIISLFLVIVIISLVYIIFFYSKTCENEGCYYKALEKCKRISYIKEQQDSTLVWRIVGKSQSNCIVEEKLIKIKKDDNRLAGLEGKSMLCELPKGSSFPPDKNIDKCHGLLKEELQRIKINDLISSINKR